MLPMLLRSAEIIARDLRAVQFVIGVSPFVTEALLRSTLAEPSLAPDGTGGRLFEETVLVNEPLAVSRSINQPGLGHVWQVRTSGGLELPAVQGWQYDVMSLASLAITIPGSNTAEMAALGLPMVVVTPLNKPEMIPLEGIPGLVGGIPLIGRHIKRQAVLAAAKRIPYTALPNRRAQAEVVPELTGELHPEDIAIAVGNLMRSPEKLKAMSQGLKQVMGEPGAARMVAETIAAALNA